MPEILYKDETFQIMGAAFEVYNHLGNGVLEAGYQEALELEFKLRGIPAEPQKLLYVLYKGHTLKQTYRADFIVYGCIVLELKAIHRIGANETAQLFNYLKTTGFKLGLILNYGAENKLEWKRVVT